MRANDIILASTLVVLFTLPTAHAGDPKAPLPPDLCEEPVHAVTGEVYTDLVGQTISRFCKPRIDPPVLDREVCCSIGASASCKFPTSVGRCTSGMKFWCEYGQQIGTSVICYQQSPDACAQGYCNGYDTGTPVFIFESTSWICCNDEGGGCVYVGEGGMTPPAEASCGGWLTSCNTGSTNEDGTVSCHGDAE
ncbi:hypothetical protein ACNOYE_06110 [Nannocystaceae bacterium ST9]